MLEEGVLAEHVTLTVVVSTRRGASRIRIGPIGGVGVVGLGWRKGRVCGSCAGVGQRVGVLGRGSVVRAAP
jgi:hypothetical protein